MQMTNPMLVLWALIVQVLSCADEGSEKDAVPRALHAAHDGLTIGRLGSGQDAAQSFEIDERAEECRNLNVGLGDENGDEVLE